MCFYTFTPKAIWRSPFAIGLLPNEAPSEQIDCKTCGRYWSKILLTEPSVEVPALLYGRRIPDATLLYSIVIFRAQVLEGLCDKGITGIKVQNVTMISRSQLSNNELERLEKRDYRIDRLIDNPPDYEKLYPTIGARLHPDSQVELHGRCSACGYVEYRTRGSAYVDPLVPSYLDACSWNGEDVFRVEELGNEVICTERFVEAWRKGKYSGLNFHPIEAL